MLVDPQTLIIHGDRFTMRAVVNSPGTFHLHEPITKRDLIVNPALAACTCGHTGPRRCPHVEHVRERVARLEMARKLADELREMADAVLRAATGDRQARDHVLDHIDGYHRQLVLGPKNVASICCADGLDIGEVPSRRVISYRMPDDLDAGDSGAAEACPPTIGHPNHG